MKVMQRIWTFLNRWVRFLQHLSCTLYSCLIHTPSIRQGGRNRKKRGRGEKLGKRGKKRLGKRFLKIRNKRQKPGSFIHFAPLTVRAGYTNVDTIQLPLIFTSLFFDPFPLKICNVSLCDTLFLRYIETCYTQNDTCLSFLKMYKTCLLQQFSSTLFIWLWGNDTPYQSRFLIVKLTSCAFSIFDQFQCRIIANSYV